MADNGNLRKADKVQFDEYYTQYEYIQKEINAYLEYDPDTFKDKVVLLPCDDPEWSNFTRFFAQNFQTLGLKKLISTSYAINSKKQSGQLNIFDFISDFEKNNENFDNSITKNRGKIFTLTRANKTIDINDLQWKYLDGDGDFLSEEVTKLRDEADIIITNPPFSIIRDFLDWIFEANKKFLIIGRETIISYKEVFPRIKDNQLWVGVTCNSSDMVFEVPEGTEIAQQDREKAAKLGYKGNFTRLGNSCWFTNLDHGRRHQSLRLMTIADNLKFNKHKEVREKGYEKFDNFDAINIPYTDSIPSDYDGLMGVPISFLSKYNPEQFEIVNGLNRYILIGHEELNEDIRKRKSHGCNINGKAKFFRIIIRRRAQNDN